MAKLSPIGNNAQFINGIPANGAKLFTYAAGSSTKQTTYTDEAGTIPQTNPIILDSRGEPSQPIWLTEGLSYKFVFTASTDSDPPVSPIWDVDDVTGVNDASITVSQWIDSGVTPTYVSATQFTLPGDQTSAFTVGRRIKALVTAGTVYGTITASVFAALTSVTVSMDSGQALDSGLSSVQLGLITPNSTSFPVNALFATPLQKQTYTAFTTGGTSSAYTGTPTPAITANAKDTRFNITLNAAPTGSPTLSVSGQTAKNLKYYDATGTKQFITSAVAPVNWNSDVIDDGTDWVMIDTMPFATTAEVKTGTVSGKAATPSTLLAAQGFTAYFESAQQTITSAGALTIAHGLGRKPILLLAYLICITGENGFTAGDEILIDGHAMDVNAAANRGQAIVADSTNINIRYGNNANTYALLNKTTGAAAAVTNANFRLVIRAWG